MPTLTQRPERYAQRTELPVIKKLMLILNIRTLVFFLGLLLITIGCNNASNTVSISNIELPVSGRVVHLNIEAIEGKQTVATSDVELVFEKTYFPKVRDSVDIPVLVRINNGFGEKFMITSSIDIETQRIESGDLRCSGLLAISTGRKISIKEAPETSSITSSDLESYEGNSPYHLSSRTAVTRSGASEDVLLKLNVKYSAAGALSSLELLRLAPDQRFSTTKNNTEATIGLDTDKSVSIKIRASGSDRK